MNFEFLRIYDLLISITVEFYYFYLSKFTKIIEISFTLKP